jgi:hypothetical protein
MLDMLPEGGRNDQSERITITAGITARIASAGENPLRTTSSSSPSNGPSNYPTDVAGLKIQDDANSAFLEPGTPFLNPNHPDYLTSLSSGSESGGDKSTLRVLKY